jgi:hypothetical protein
VRICKPVDRQIKLRGQEAAGILGAHHKRIRLCATIARRFSLIAIVLLVDAVKFQQCRRFLTERRSVVAQLLGYRAAQTVTACLHRFDIKLTHEYLQKQKNLRRDGEGSQTTRIRRLVRSP